MRFILALCFLVLTAIPGTSLEKSRDLGFWFTSEKDPEWIQNNSTRNELTIVGSAISVPGGASVPVTLVVNASNSGTLPLPGALCLPDVFSIFVFGDPKNSIIRPTQSADWLLVLNGRADHNHDSISSLVTDTVDRNIKSLLTNEFEVLFKELLLQNETCKSFTDERVEKITISFQQFLANQSLRVAIDSGRNVDSFIQSLAKLPVIANSPEFRELQRQSMASSTCTDFSFLINIIRTSSASPKEIARAISQLDTLISATEIPDVINIVAKDVFPLENSELTKAVLRKFANKPDPTYFQTFVLLLDSSDPMVAYHAIRALHAFGFPDAPELPAAQAFRLNSSHHQTEWKAFILKMDDEVLHEILQSHSPRSR